MMKKVFFLSIVWSFLFSVVLFAGGPWANGKGKGYTEIGVSGLLSRSIRDISIQSYSEFGVHDRVTLRFILPVRVVGTKADNTLPEANLFGINNVTIGTRYQFLKKPFSMSAGLDVKVRAFNINRSRGLRTGYEKWTFVPNISLGKGFDRAYVYTDIYGELVTNRYSHNMGITVEGGGAIEKEKKAWLAVYLNYLYTFSNGTFNSTDSPTFLNTGFGIDREHYLTIGPKLSVALYRGFGISVNALYTFGFGTNGGGSGGNVLSLKGGVYYQWDGSIIKKMRQQKK